jgi:hypothetical protein
MHLVKHVVQFYKANFGVNFIDFDLAESNFKSNMVQFTLKINFLAKPVGYFISSWAS